MSEIISGITYYELESPYSGDTTKNCGLTACELDNNFFFLRGKQITGMTWNPDSATFILQSLDGTTIETDTIDPYITESLKELLTGVTESIEQLESDVSGVTDSIEGIYEEIDTRFDEFNEAFSDYKEEINEKVDSTTSALTEAFCRINSLESDVDSIYHDMGVLSGMIENNTTLILSSVTYLEDRVTITGNDVEEFFE